MSKDGRVNVAQCGPRDVVRKRMDYVLLALTLLCLLLYLLVVRLIPEIHRGFESVDVLWMGPLTFMFVGIAAAAYWLARGGATQQHRLIWAAFVTLGLVSWLPSLIFIGIASGGLVR